MPRWVWIGLTLFGVALLTGSACVFGVAVGATASGGGPVGSGPAIALLPITGAIEGGEGGGAFAAEGAYAGRITSTLRRIQRDPRIKAVVLRIDSPGGGVTPSDEIHNEVVRTRTQFSKPVVVSVGSLAASGGYYIAVGADRIITNPTSITGSIGVITVVPNLQGLMEKVGVTATVLTTGPYKDAGSGLRPITEDERQQLQGILDDAYGRFVKVVADGRKMDESRVRALADGRIYSATQAKELGLIDDFGDQPDAIKVAAQLAGLGSDPNVIDFGRRSGFSSLFSGASTFWPGPASTLTNVVRPHGTSLLNYLYLLP